MTRNAQLYLNDIIESIQKIQRYTAKMSFEEFAVNSMAIDAVIRNLEVMGEAAKHIPDDILSKYSEIPWFEMKGMRNIIAHEYFRVDLKIVWQTISESLPALVPLLKRVISEIQ